MIHGGLVAQEATVSEKSVWMPTYPFSDPNPIAARVDAHPAMYPYHRFDGYTNRPIQQKWKQVELENDFIKVLIFPEIGGKIWTAIEKKNDRPFLYYNHVVKFRDIAMRGAWTSGGIEFNYGIIGHTPNCATPVDYFTRKNEDGSVSCFIGTLDLVTRSRWTVEINLPHDKAYFVTRSFWHNPMPVPQPYYHWMNAAIPSAGNLEFIAPGTHYIGHEGELGDWPVDPENGKRLSFYEQNDFGEYKSYHIVGKQTDFFGGYWHDKNFGMARYAPGTDKPGKKLFIWGLSEQGMIWEKILSDDDGQYVEVQSGRLFNQNVEKSSYTPFKQTAFNPYSTDSWAEYWFPVLQTGGISVANPIGALHVSDDKENLRFYFSPVIAISDSIRVSIDGTALYNRFVKLSPLEPFFDSVSTGGRSGNIIVDIGNGKLVYNQKEQSDTLARPLVAPADAAQTAHHYYRLAYDRIAQKFYGAAQDFLHQALAKDAYHIPSLTTMAWLQYHYMKYDSVAWYARKALSLDTYDGAANYYYGLAAIKQGHIDDARDAFGIASQSAAFRSAANTELARIHLRKKHYEAAIRYADKAIIFNAHNVSAYEIKAIAYRYLEAASVNIGRQAVRGQTASAQPAISHVPNTGNRQPAMSKTPASQAAAVLDLLLQIDPLNHFVRFEKYLRDSLSSPYDSFASLIRNEMPEQTVLELAISYYNNGCIDEASQLLSRLPATPEACYWLAWINSVRGKPYAQSLDRAEKLGAELVFPFRAETAPVLQWAIGQTDSWKPKYYLALVYRAHSRISECRALLEACGAEPDLAPFYVVRSEMSRSDRSSALADLKKAATLDPEGWRYQKLLAEYHVEHGAHREALDIMRAYYQKNPSDYKMGVLFARVLLLNHQYRQADKVLSGLFIIPFEGATEGHELYRQAKLMQAWQAAQRGKFKEGLRFAAQAREWPTHLGSGKPYAADIDERIMDYLEAICYRGMKRETEWRNALERIVQIPAGHKVMPTSILLRAWALDNLHPGEKRGAELLTADTTANRPDDQILKWATELYYRGTSKAFPETAKGTDAWVIEAIASDARQK